MKKFTVLSLLVFASFFFSISVFSYNSPVKTEQDFTITYSGDGDTHEYIIDGIDEDNTHFPTLADSLQHIKSKQLANPIILFGATPEQLRFPLWEMAVIDFGCTIKGNITPKTETSNIVFDNITSFDAFFQASVITNIAHGIFVNQSANVTIEDGTEIITQYPSSAIVFNSGTGSLTINGGNINANEGVGIQKIGSALLTINRGTIISSGNQFNSTIHILSSGLSTKQLVVTGGLIKNTGSGYAIGIPVDHKGLVEITNGTIQSSSQAAINNRGQGLLEIKGGTIKSDTGSAIHNHTAGDIIITNGTIESNYNAIWNTGKIKITGCNVVSEWGNAILHASEEKLLIEKNPETLVSLLSKGEGSTIYISHGTLKEKAVEINNAIIKSTGKGSVIETTDVNAGNVFIHNSTIEHTGNVNPFNIKGTGVVTISEGTVISNCSTSIRQPDNLLFNGGHIFKYYQTDAQPSQIVTLIQDSSTPDKYTFNIPTDTLLIVATYIAPDVFPYYNIFTKDDNFTHIHLPDSEIGNTDFYLLDMKSKSLLNITLNI